MKTIVSKFGGSSLATPKQIEKVVAIIQSNPERRHIVVSAPGIGSNYRKKVTNQLIKAGNEVCNDKFILLIEGVIKRFEKIVKHFNLKKINLSKERNLIIQNSHKKDLTPNYEYVVSRGEYIMAKILSEILNYNFIDSYDCLLLDDKGSPNNNFLELSRAHKNKKTVTSGFYGKSPSGHHKIMSRGGSDTTGAVIASAVDASLYEIWTDVSGISMAHPKVVKNPKILTHITHGEMRELSYMGAEVVHEEALFPVQDADIPTKVLNTDYPNDPGTLIVRRDHKEPDPDNPITGIAGKKGFSILRTAKRRMNSEVGYVFKLLRVLSNYEISFDTPPSGIDTFSLMIETTQLKDRKSILSDIAIACSPDSITIEDGLAMLSIVGMGMIHTQGILSRVSGSLFNAGVNIRNISQEDSEMSIIIGINEKDYENAINAIYKEFA
jgi:aspartate kinase